MNITERLSFVKMYNITKNWSEYKYSNKYKIVFKNNKYYIMRDVFIDNVLLIDNLDIDEIALFRDLRLSNEEFNKMFGLEGIRSNIYTVYDVYSSYSAENINFCFSDRDIAEKMLKKINDRIIVNKFLNKI